MKIRITLFICFLFCSSTAVAQKISYGLTTGLIFDNPTGTVLLDSVQVTLQGDNDRQPYYGGYISYELNQLLTFTFGINYYNAGTSFLVYNAKKECAFCPLMKAGSVSHRSIEVPLLVEVKLPLPIGRVFLSAGIIPNFRLFSKGDPYFYYPDAGQGVSDVLPAIKSSIKPVVWKYALGAGAIIWRLRLEARWQYDLARTANNPIQVWGKSYAFNSKNNTIRFGVGYQLNWKKKE